MKILFENDNVKDLITRHSIRIATEWLPGQIRSYDNSDYKRLMPVAYGFIPNTTSEDGEEIDVYVGVHDNPNHVFVVDQLAGAHDPANDLTKLLNSNLKAKNVILKHYDIIDNKLIRKIK